MPIAERSFENVREILPQERLAASYEYTSNSLIVQTSGRSA
jgi:hypothetical protein